MRMPPATFTAPSPRRTFATVLAGILLVQLAWILVLPAFGGIDEFDHVYKADAVGHGHLGQLGPPAHGRGGLVRVSPDVVEAASDLCSSYVYTGRDNCHPVGQRTDGTVTVASGAATYNPAYYAVVGVLARPFHGVAADVAMRVLTAVCAALLLAWAAVVTTSWARNRWPLVCLGLATTPVLVYSTAITSPNGVGYAAAALLWAAGIGLVESSRRTTVLPLVVAALVMVCTHTTGVLWLGLVLLVLTMAKPLRDWRDQVRSDPAGFALGGAAIALGGLACVGWIMLAGTNALNPIDSDIPPLRVLSLLSVAVLWVFQTIAAFPLRDQVAPLAVYALWLVPFALVMLLGLRAGTRRLRLGVALLLAAWVLVPLGLTLVSYPSEGFAWQGRYALPLALGFPALAGLALNRRPGLPVLPALLAFGTYAAAHAVSVGSVGARFGISEHSPTLATYVPGGFAVATVMALVGGLLPALLLVRRPGTAVPGTGDAAKHLGAPTPEPVTGHAS